MGKLAIFGCNFGFVTPKERLCNLCDNTSLLLCFAFLGMLVSLHIVTNFISLLRFKNISDISFTWSSPISQMANSNNANSNLFLMRFHDKGS